MEKRNERFLNNLIQLDLYTTIHIYTRMKNEENESFEFNTKSQ